MSQQIKKQTLTNQSRRNFLKGAAYTSALSVGGMSSLAFAISGDTAVKTKGNTDLSDNKISVMQQKMLHKETVSLFNNNDEAIMLDALQPVKIERVSGSLIVKPNIIESGAVALTGMIMMHPRQRISFDIQTTGGVFSSAEIADASKLSGQQLHITSGNASFNKLIPVTNHEFKEAMPTSPIMAYV